MEIDADVELEALKAMGAWQEEFKVKFGEYCTRAEQIFPCFVRPRLIFGGRGQAAGMARYQDNEVRLNPTFCQTEKADMLRETLPHEVAHILAWQRWKESGHGAGWAAMYGALTWRRPTRCHDYGDVQAAKARVQA